VPEIEYTAQDLTPFDTAIALNNGDGPLAIIEKQDGVLVSRQPKVWLLGGNEIMVDLQDLCVAAGWEYSENEDGSIAMNMAGNAVEVSWNENTAVCLINGNELQDSANAFIKDPDGRSVVRASALEEILNADVTWDSDENTLMIHTKTSDETS